MPLLDRFNQSLARFQAQFSAAQEARAGQPEGEVQQLLARLGPVLGAVCQEFPQVRHGQSAAGDVAVLTVSTGSLHLKSTVRFDSAARRFLRCDEIDLDPWRLDGPAPDGRPATDLREFSFASMDEALLAWVDWLAWLAALLRSERDALQAGSQADTQGL